VIAFKFLAPGGIGRFSKLHWPLPSATGPGVWLAGRQPPEPCRHGVHACHAHQLAYWLDAMLWEIELDGEIVETETMLVGARGRLVRAVDAWNLETQRELAQACVRRAQAWLARLECASHPELARARSWAGDVEHFARSDQAATAAYVGAVLAHVGNELAAEQAYAAERRVQAQWLAERLKLAAA
jgi:hypothetical protein